MELVLLTALGVGGATVAGTLIGFLFRRIPPKWNDAIMGFAAGVMLAAAMVGLILPAAELTGRRGLWQVIAGILTGAVFLNLMDRLTPHLHHLSGISREEAHNNHDLNRVLLFVLAIAIHNLPEGLAAGVGFGGEDIDNALTVALGIALQNIPEGMVLVSPLLLAGVSRQRTLVLASATGLIEVFGVLIGYLASTISASVLPFALAFAGGTMLYVVGDEMIPETHSHGYERMATYSMIFGFCLMLVLDVCI